jgi:hypothetical protein
MAHSYGVGTRAQYHGPTNAGGHFSTIQRDAKYGLRPKRLLDPAHTRMAGETYAFAERFLVGRPSPTESGQKVNGARLNLA